MILDSKFWEEYRGDNLRYDDDEYMEKIEIPRRRKTENMPLEEYVEKIRTCQDEEKLLTDLNIYDNYFVYFFGEPETHSKILNFFATSDMWMPEKTAPLSTTPYFIFKHPTQTCDRGSLASVHQGSPKGNKNIINGKPFSVRTCFHPANYHLTGFENYDWKNMALAIAGMLDYVRKENIPCFVEKPNIIFPKK